MLCSSFSLQLPAVLMLVVNVDRQVHLQVHALQLKTEVSINTPMRHFLRETEHNDSEEPAKASILLRA